MPELPEVEIIKLQLEKLIVGKEILSMGVKITKIGRRAKLLLNFLDNGGFLVFHLKLTGRILVRKSSGPKDDWQRIVLPLSDGLDLRFCDARKFGWMKFVKNKEKLNKLLEKLGPEPSFTKATEGQGSLTLDLFKKILSTSRRPIKVVLMDQEKIAGIGNIYAVDALNLARVDPRTPANQLSNQLTNQLFDAILKVLKDGIRFGGASDQYYLDARGEKGHYQEHFLVYNRRGEKCFNCGGLIKKFFLAGRGTYWCPNCQK